MCSGEEHSVQSETGLNAVRHIKDCLRLCRWSVCGFSNLQIEIVPSYFLVSVERKRVTQTFYTLQISLEVSSSAGRLS